MKISEIGGKRFSRLTTIKYLGVINKKSKWLCLCDCGNSIVVIGSNLLNGNTNSCGCYQRERTSQVATKQGMSRTPVHNLWKNMIQRCGNKNGKNYKYYGERGIHVCDRWLVFDNFYEDMGDIPKGKTLDRIDNNKGYCKENCRWATGEEQQNNTRKNHMITFKGKTQPLSMWCRELQINYDMVWDRLKNNWGVDRALTEPSGFSATNRNRRVLA